MCADRQNSSELGQTCFSSFVLPFLFWSKSETHARNPPQKNASWIKTVQKLHSCTQTLHSWFSANFLYNKSNRVRTTDAFWRTARVLVLKLSIKWHSFMFPMLFCSNSAHFSENQLVCDLRTDGRTVGRTDRRTDTPSHRDARTHLKRIELKTWQ